MKIVKILGGLGNQMFQYALFLSLKERFSHEQVMIDTSCFRNYPLHNGFEVDRIFAQKAPVASWRNILKVAYPYPNYRFWKIGKYILPKRKTMCVERKNFSFDAAVLTRKGDCYYDGYWQHEEYFCDMKETIWEAFSFPEPVDGRNKEIGALLQASDSVSLHVRRGDYVNHPLFRGICDLDYYKRAIHYMEERVNPQLYCVFSNDMAWCESHLRALLPGKEVVYVDWNKGAESYVDMRLMSLCQHNIIANSSFSWWGAWLNRNPQKVVGAPERWMNSPIEDPVSDKWIKL